MFGAAGTDRTAVDTSTISPGSKATQNEASSQRAAAATAPNATVVGDDAVRDPQADINAAVGVVATNFGLATGVGAMVGGVGGAMIGCPVGAVTGGLVAVPTSLATLAVPAAAFGCWPRLLLRRTRPNGRPQRKHLPRRRRPWSRIRRSADPIPRKLLPPLEHARDVSHGRRRGRRHHMGPRGPSHRRLFTNGWSLDIARDANTDEQRYTADRCPQMHLGLNRSPGSASRSIDRLGAPPWATGDFMLGTWGPVTGKVALRDCGW